ncbi:general substrate transporter [Meredithblackwellia eburnea MCA 4105]
MPGGSAHYATLQNNTNSKWWLDPGMRTNIYHGFGLCMCVYYLGYDASLLTGLQSLPQWNKFFGSPSGTKLGLISASLFFPAIPCAFISDKLGEYTGRRPQVWFGATLIIIGALVNSLGHSLGTFVAGRAIIGAGGGFAKVMAPSLLQEITHPRLRPIMAAVFYCFYYTGSTLSAWLCFGTLHMKGNWAWRTPSLFQIFGPLLVIVITLTAPESPRWLVKHGKKDQAMQILAKYHANGKVDDPLVQLEYSEICTAIELEEQSNQVSYLDFFRTRGNFHRIMVVILIAFGTNWVGNGIVSYYLSPILKSIGITSPVQQTGINAGLAMFNLVVATVGAFQVERFGRRPLWLGSTIGMFFSYVIIMALAATFAIKHNKHAGTAVVPFLFIFYGCYDFGWTPLPYSYCTEILPFNMRTKGMAIFVATQAVGNAFNQFVNPIALKALVWKYYGVYLAIQLFYIVIIYFFFPETKGHTIEEVSMIFDRDSSGRNAKLEKLEAEAIADMHADNASAGKGSVDHRESA